MVEDIKKWGWLVMRGKFNIALFIEDEATGKVIRNLKTDLYIDVCDEESIRLIKNCITSACRSCSEIVKEV